MQFDAIHYHPERFELGSRLSSSGSGVVELKPSPQTSRSRGKRQSLQPLVIPSHLYSPVFTFMKGMSVFNLA